MSRRRDTRRIELVSTITCPECGHRTTETMPEDSCQYAYDCKGCGAVIRARHGDCCVFCSYGTVPCPPVQVGGAGRCRPNTVDHSGDSR